MYLKVDTYEQSRLFSLISHKKDIKCDSLICLCPIEFIQKGIIEKKTLVLSLSNVYYFILILRWFENIDNCCKLDGNYGIMYAEECHTQLKFLLPEVEAYFNGE